jgi:hypothetical protein
VPSLTRPRSVSKATSPLYPRYSEAQIVHVCDDLVPQELTGASRTRAIAAILMQWVDDRNAYRRKHREPRAGLSLLEAWKLM